jgi:hypothetical protein
MDGQLLKGLRNHFKLNLVEAASSLELTASQLERRESGKSVDLDLDAVKYKFQKFSLLKQKGSSNLLFGKLPLRTARDAQVLSVEAAASKYGTSTSQWRKFECHARLLDPEKKKIIEEDTKEALLAMLC